MDVDALVAVFAENLGNIAHAINRLADSIDRLDLTVEADRIAEAIREAAVDAGQIADAIQARDE